MSWFNQAKSYWQNELANMSGIQQGNMTPMELPEFKGMQSTWNANMDNILQNAIRQLSQSGVQGGKANQLLSSLGSADQSGLLKMIQAIYGQANQRGTQAANTAFDWKKFMMNYDLQSDAQKAQNRQTDFGQWMGAIKTAAGMGLGAMTGFGGQGAGYQTQMQDYYNRTYNNPQSSSYYQGY